jgi:organic radical activating enzyme
MLPTLASLWQDVLIRSAGPPEGSRELSRIHLRAVEINAVWQCNLSCVACTHASPVTAEQVTDPATVERDLANLSTVLDVDVIRVLGGEPLLHPDLPALLRAVRRSGMSGMIRVSTNGTRLHATDFAWLDLVDEVHVSRYPGTRVDPGGLAELTRLCTLSDKTLILKDFHSFRHAFPQRPLTPDETRDVYDTCQQANSWSCHTVENGYLHLCPTTANPAFKEPEACPIEPLDTLADRLTEFLNSPEPLRACANCLGTVGALFRHQQANAKTWLTLSTAGSIDRDQLEAVRRDPLALNGCATHEVLAQGPVQSHWVGLVKTPSS